jgi:hypothetical protein
MRLKHGVSLLATVATAAAISAPSAYATWPSPDGGYTATVVPAQQHPSGSPDWELIGFGAAGGVALLGAGAIGSRRLSQRTASATVPSGR